MGKGEIARFEHFSFSHSVFKRLVFQGRQKVLLCGNGLIHSQFTNFRLFQTQKFVEDNLKFDENGRKFSKEIENTVGKGEIAHYEQFIPFPQCFQKTCTADT